MNSPKISELLDLSKVGGLSRLVGYWTDKDCNIYSTRRGPEPQLLQGSNTPSGRYYTLASSTYHAAVLKMQIQASKEFDQWKKNLVVRPYAQVSQVLQSTQSGKRDWANNAKEGVRARGWVIATIENGGLSFSETPKIHVTPASANDELNRLCVEHPGREFVLLRIQHGQSLAVSTF